MSYPREGHRQTLLVDGRVLVTGGAVELYHPRIGAWTAAADMRTARRGHTASRLGNGAVLAAGGVAGRDITADAEIYDAVSDTWNQTGSLNSARLGAQAVLLQDGRVMVMGGVGPDARTIVSSAEIYDPATGRWSVAAPMSSPRLWHTATLLADGKVLVAGGVPAFNLAPLKTAELFDPVAGEWSSAGEMMVTRSGHTANLLRDGNVLIAGGPEEITATEIFDSKKLAWTRAGEMREGRGEPSATLLPDGRVLIAGGYNLAVTFFYKNLDSSEIYDPVTQRWDPGPKLVRGRAGQQATFLKNGKVLVTGGMADWDAELVIRDAEIFGASPVGPGSIAAVSAASFMDNALLAPDSIAAAFGRNLALLKAVAESGPLPITIAGISLRVRDAAGMVREAPILLISPEQINFVVPAGTSSGPGTVTVVREGNLIASGPVEIANTAPALFSMDATGDGLPVAQIQRIRRDGTQSVESVSRFDGASNQFIALPVDLGGPDDQVVLLLYATGVRGYGTKTGLEGRIGGMRAQVVSMEASSEFAGVDQIAISLPHSLKGKGEVEVSVSVAGLESNVTRIRVQ